MSRFDDLPPDVQPSAVFMVILLIYMTVCTSYASYKLVYAIMENVPEHRNACAGAGAVVGVVLVYICLRCIDAITEHYIGKEKKL